jgi:hypothetical protein
MMEDETALDDFNKTITTLIVGFVIGGIFGYCSAGFNYKEKVSTPVEKVDIDSLVKTNDSIKLVVEHLDSVKDAKIIEVSSLNNDSTLKLFYKLVSE